MSSGKFASVTASLLARKGEGQPWTQTASQEGGRQPLAWRSEIPAAPSPPAAEWAAQPAPAVPPPPPPGKDKSCSLRMSPHDFERLGILSVKAGVPRQALLKDALSQLLAAKARDYGCACMGACDPQCCQAD